MRNVAGLMVLVISLCTPGLSFAQTDADTALPVRKDPLIGLWKDASESPTQFGCLSIVQEPDGSLSGLSNGSRVHIVRSNPGFFSLEFNADSAVCCSHTFMGHLSKDRSTLSGSWQEGPNQASYKGSWQRAGGNSCQSKPRRVVVSAGVAAGMLKSSVAPVYPAEALKNHASRTVVLRAAISAEGRVETLRVISGPASLRQAALDAVRQWIYRPYLLNGVAVNVESTINVDFKPSH